MPVHRDPTGDDPERVQARSGDPPTGDKAGTSPAPGEDSSSGGFTVRSVDVSVPRTGEIPVAGSPPVATEAPPPDPMVGRTLAGRFRVQAPLGRGGMGQVYKAEQLPLGRPVALKVMVPHFAAAPDTEYEQRFFLEAAVASKITHPNVITVFDYGKDEDTFFIAMEFLHGRTLSRALAADGPFPLARVIHIATQAARGAREAHRQGAIHRDLKPANIMLIDHNEDPDFVKILDFGLVK
ncbi:MAG: serine/threonine protein kinase, partial [Deltaproteobacteria bacterium]|nr:serine/threonine protein kinase [Deltaproteobacteria bacterium]